jgi:hypothetical protein
MQLAYLSRVTLTMLFSFENFKKRKSLKDQTYKKYNLKMDLKEISWDVVGGFHTAHDRNK